MFEVSIVFGDLAHGFIFIWIFFVLIETNCVVLGVFVLHFVLGEDFLFGIFGLLFEAEPSEFWEDYFVFDWNTDREVLCAYYF